MDNKKLAEALRLFVMANKYPTPARLLEAADLVEALTAQLAEKDKQLADAETRHRVEYCESTGYDCEVRGQLAAAVEDLEALMEKTQSAEACHICANDHDHAVCGSNFTRCAPKWRGPQEAGEVE